MVEKRPSEGVWCAACALVLLLATPCAYSQADLTGAVWTNGQFQFTLNNWMGAHAVVESSPDLVNWTPVATNYITTAHCRISVPATDNMVFYRTVANRVLLPLPAFAYALGAIGNIEMNGGYAITDSFNSGDTNLSTNGQYDPSKTNENGNVASVQGLVNIGQDTIGGSLFLGPIASYVNSANQIMGTIHYDSNIQFPDVALPTGIVWQVAQETNIGTGKRTTYIYDFTSVNNNGYYLINNSDRIVVEPGITVTLQLTTETFSPTSITINGGMTNSGSIVMYHNPSSPGGSVTLGGNSGGGAIGSRPANFIYFGMPNVTSVTLSSSSIFIGVIYAPEATLTLNFGGNAANFCGSCIAGSLTLNGHYYLHFDESLLTAGPFGYYYSWQ